MELLIILAVFAVLGLYVMLTYNKIIACYNSVKQAWADVLVQERQRGRIIVELEKILDKHTAYEKSVQENITRLRQGLAGLNENTIDPKAQNNVDLAHKELMKSISVAVENYPELKASESFAKMMNEISNQEENVGAALRIFNANVNDFNSLIQSVPSNVVNNVFHKKLPIDTFSDKTASASFDYKPNFD